MWSDPAERKPGHRSRLVTAMIVATLIGLMTTGCGEPADDRIPGPNMSVSFGLDPGAAIVVGANDIDLDDVELQAGQTLEITNETGHRIRFAGSGFDTGEMLDGESTVIAFTEVADVDLVQRLGGDHTIHVTVVAVEPEG